MAEEKETKSKELAIRFAEITKHNVGQVRMNAIIAKGLTIDDQTIYPLTDKPKRFSQSTLHIF